MLALMTRTHIHAHKRTTHTYINTQTHTEYMLAESNVKTSTVSSTKEPKRLHFGEKKAKSIIETMNIKWPGHNFRFCLSISAIQFKASVNL